MDRHRKRLYRRGFALASSILLAFLFLLCGLALLGGAQTARRLSARRVLNAQALSLAITGGDMAVAGFKSNSTYMLAGTSASYRLGPGTLTLSNALVSGYNQVTVTSTVAGSFANVTKRVRVTMSKPTSSYPVFNFAISSKQDLTVSGGTNTTSAPTAHGGSVATNGNLTLSGGLTVIDGNASAGGTISNSGATVYGTTSPLSTPITFPDIDQSMKDQATADGSSNGGVTLSSGPTQTMQGVYKGNVTVSGAGCTIKNNAVVWVQGQLLLNGPITGTGTIICDGQIKAQGGAYTDATRVMFITTYPRTTSNPTATAANQDGITLSGGSTVYGWFYAPYARLTVSGGTSVYGGISAMALALSGGSVITVPTNWNIPSQYQSSSGLVAWEEL